MYSDCSNILSPECGLNLLIYFFIFTLMWGLLRATCIKYDANITKYIDKLKD